MFSITFKSGKCIMEEAEIYFSSKGNSFVNKTFFVVTDREKEWKNTK